MSYILCFTLMQFSIRDSFLERVKSLAKAGSQQLQKKSTMIEVRTGSDQQAWSLLFNIFLQQDSIEDLICLAIEFKPNMNPVAGPGPSEDPKLVDLRYSIAICSFDTLVLLL